MALQDTTAEITARCQIAYALDFGGWLSEAKQQYEAALTVSRQSGNSELELLMLGNLTGKRCYDDQPDYISDRVKEALDIARALGSDAGLFRTLHNFAVTLNANKRPREALKYLSDSTAVAERLGDRRYLATNAHGLGFTYLLLEDHENAELAYAKAADLFHRIGEDYRQVECIHGVARALHGQGRTAEARQAVAQAEKILDQLAHDQAAYYRRRLVSSPLYYSESVGIDPTARA